MIELIFYGTSTLLLVVLIIAAIIDSELHRDYGYEISRDYFDSNHKKNQKSRK